MYFPDVTYSTMEEYRQLKAKVCRHFPAFDSQAKDAARFFFGVEIPQVKYYPGNRLLSEFLETVTISANSKTEQAGRHKADQTDTIPEGKRNTTMFHFAEHILRKKGDTQEAYQAYMDESKKCSPPLPQNELMSTWKSAQKRYHNAVQNSTDENTTKSAWALLALSDHCRALQLRRESDRGARGFGTTGRTRYRQNTIFPASRYPGGIFQRRRNTGYVEQG